MVWAMQWSLHPPWKTRWEAVGSWGGPAPGWGKGDGSARRALGLARVPWAGGSPAPGKPATPSILVDGGGERRLVSPPSRPRPSPLPTAAGPQAPEAGAVPGAEWQNPVWAAQGPSFWAPHGGSGFERVPSSLGSSDKMEDVASCCSHDGRWGGATLPHGGEARVEVSPRPSERPAVPCTRGPDRALGLVSGLAGLGPSRGAPRPWTARAPGASRPPAS